MLTHKRRRHVQPLQPQGTDPSPTHRYSTRADLGTGLRQTRGALRQDCEIKSVECSTGPFRSVEPGRLRQSTTHPVSTDDPCGRSWPSSKTVACAREVERWLDLVWLRSI